MSEASRGVPLELIHDECWGVPIVIDKNTSVYIHSPKVYLGVWPLIMDLSTIVWLFVHKV